MNRIAGAHTRAAVLVAGLAGLAIIARAAVFYRGVDALSFGIVCVMAVALALGVAELFARATRVARLDAELSELPKEPGAKLLEEVSPVLRALLRSRIEREPMPSQGPVFTPYLIGLLVMLGLLGTFLGLFETLRGAREALTTTADVEALRAGLAHPMQGLMRSFGTSAAGVAASAMLGLGAVFTRRASRRLDIGLHTYAAGPLARFSPARRQLEALEALAEQGRAFPAAAEALRDAAERLGALEGSWRDSHAAAAAETQDAIREVMAESAKALRSGLAEERAATEEALRASLEGTERAFAGTASAVGEELTKAVSAMREELATGVAQAAEKSHLAAAKVAEEAMTGAVSAATRHLDLVLGAVEKDAAKRNEAHEALAARLDERLGAVGDKLDAAAVRLDSHLGEVVASLDAEVDRRAEADGRILTSLETHAARFQAHAAELRDLEAERTAALEAHVSRLLTAEGTRAEALEEHVERIVASEQARADALAARWSEITATLSKALEGAATRDAERAQSLAEVAAQMQGDLAQATEVVRERLDAAASHDAAQAERATELLTHFEATAAKMTDASARQAEALDAFIAAAEARVEDAEGRHAERLAELAGRFEAAAEAQTKRLSTFEEELAERHRGGAEQLAERLAEHAKGLDHALAETSKVVEEAAGLVHAGGTELTATAEMFSAAVDQQRAAAAEWLDGLGRIDAAVTDAGEHAAVDVLGQYLARTHELFDQQLLFQKELFERLEQASPAALTEMARNESGNEAHAPV